MFSISQGILKGAKCWLPPLPEQTAIAEFLDRETAKIDGLVAVQRRLMELLKEKRQAVISHAVTKGLRGQANGRNAMRVFPSRHSTESSRPSNWPVQATEIPEEPHSWCCLSLRNPRRVGGLSSRIR